MIRRFGNVVGWCVLLGAFAGALACILSPVSWSPDGKWVAFTHYAEFEEPKGVTRSELWIASPEPLERRLVLATSGTALSAPSWMPDGKGLYVVEYVEHEGSSYTAALLKVGLDGTRSEIIKLPAAKEAGVGMVIAPLVAPDGRIAFMSDEQNAAIVKDGKIEKATTGGAVLAWSRDGRWLGMVTDIAGQGNRIRVIDMKTGDARDLDIPTEVFAWTPDGKRLVAVKQKDGKYFVAVYDPAAEFREVAAYEQKLEGGGHLAISPDGKYVYFGREDEKIVRLELGTGESAVVYQSNESVVPWSITPDGKRLAFRETTKTSSNEGQSIVGVLFLDAPEKVVYLPVDQPLLAEVIEQQLSDLQKDAGAGEKARVANQRLERLIGAFEKAFPTAKQGFRKQFEKARSVQK